MSYPTHILSNVILFFGARNKHAFYTFARTNRDIRVACRTIADCTIFTKISPYRTVNRDMFRKYHSINDQPAITYADGTSFWCNHGLFHREGNQPAAIYDSGDRKWFYRGVYHRDERIDGWLQPAIIYTSGRCEWYINGTQIEC